MINADTYSEVYEILSYMNKSIVMKVPVEILGVIKENRNLDYVSNECCGLLSHRIQHGILSLFPDSDS